MLTNSDISLVVPVYKGEHFVQALVEAIDRLHRDITQSGLPLRLSECIFVSDSCIDNSIEVLQGLKAHYPWIRILTLSRNYGQHPATVAGILHSSGDWVVTLDEDLQHHPSYILQMLCKLCSSQADLVYAAPISDVHAAAYRNFGSRFVKRLTASLAGDPSILMFNSYRVIRGQIARAAAASCAAETYFDIAITWFTKSICTYPIQLDDRRTRLGQESGYNLRGLVRHAGRLLLTSDSRVLRFGSRLGAFGMLFAAILIIAIVGLKVAAPDFIPVQGWASTMILLLTLSSLLSIQCGIATKYLSVILQRTQGRPTFFVVDRSADFALAEQLTSYLSRNRVDGFYQEPI